MSGPQSPVQPVQLLDRRFRQRAVLVDEERQKRFHGDLLRGIRADAAHSTTRQSRLIESGTIQHVESQYVTTSRSLAVVGQEDTKPVVQLAIKGRADDGWYPLSKMLILR